MSCTQILYDVLDFHQELYYEGAKRRARLVVWTTAMLAVQVVLTIIFLRYVSEPFAFFFLGTVSGMWIYSLCDAICARKLYKEYLRYRLEVECDAYSEEAKK